VSAERLGLDDPPSSQSLTVLHEEEQGMPEGPGNIELAHTLHERAERGGGDRGRFEEIVEIVEAFLLAFVAIATAWSGYQAARWDGREAFLYGEATKIRITADQTATLGGQQRLYDISTFNSWAQAAWSGDHDLADLFERRFRPEYLVAFRAWMKLDPLHNRSAPPGPIFMPEYHNSLAEQAARLHTEASATFDRGTRARETGDDYVRTTVLLATVLFVIALSQRFKIRSLRIGLVSVGAVFLVVALSAVATYPHI
jgi:hypothetical protein